MQSGVEMQRKTFVKKEASNQQFAIIGSCNTAAPVQLSRRPPPPARKQLNLPTASAKEVEERFSEIGSLSQHMKSRPTTRTSMQTSDGMSKSSFQQYILATADYMHTSSEPFSIASGSPLSSHTQSQMHSKQMPLRVQSLPNFSTYVSDYQIADGFSEQQDYGKSDVYGSETALDVGTKKHNRALKLEVDLRVATNLSSAEIPGESDPTESMRPEQLDIPTSSGEVPSVNIIQSVSPSQSYPSYPPAPVQQKHDGITVVHSDGIYWTSHEPFATVPCIDTSSLAVSDTASQSSSTMTLKDDGTHPQPYSESLYDDQLTADRSLLYEQDESLMSSSNRGACIGSFSDVSANLDAIQPDKLLNIQADQFPSFTSQQESINVYSSGSPGHLTYSTNTVTPAGDKLSRITTDVGSGVTPISQLSHDILSLRHDLLSTIPTLKETSASAPTILNTAESGGTSDNYASPEHSLQVPSGGLSQIDRSNSIGNEATTMLTRQSGYGGHLLECNSELEDSGIPDVQQAPSVPADSSDVTGVMQSSHAAEQKDSESLSSTSLKEVEIKQTTEDVATSEILQQSPDGSASHSQEDLQITTEYLNMTEHKGMISEAVPLVLIDSSGHLDGEGERVMMSEAPNEPLHGALSTEKVMEKLLSNETEDLPAQSLAVSPFCICMYIHVLCTYVCMCKTNF